MTMHPDTAELTLKLLKRNRCILCFKLSKMTILEATILLQAVITAAPKELPETMRDRLSVGSSSAAPSHIYSLGLFIR